MIDFSTEIVFQTARSGGKGGQNVNKVETMVEASWLVQSSVFFDDGQKALIVAKLANRINSEGWLRVRSSEARTQLANRKRVLEKMMLLVNESIIRPKKRRPTKPSKAVVEKRLESKKRLAEKKKGRKNEW